MSTQSAERVAVGVAAIAVALLGFEWLEPSGSLGITRDLRLTDVRLALILTIVGWVYWLALARRWPRRPSGIALPLGVWLVVLLVSALQAPIYQTQALAFVRDMLLCTVFGWAIYDLARTASRQVLLARALAVCGMGVACFGLAEAVGIAGIPDWLRNFRYQAAFSVGDVLRVSSTLPHPNIAAMLLGLCLPLQLAWLASTRSPWGRLVLGLGALAQLAVLVLTVSRAGIVVAELVLGGMLLAAIWNHQARVRRATLAAAVAVPVLVGLAVARQPVLLLHGIGEAVQTWYRADYLTPTDLTAHPGETATVPVRLANTGDRIWLASGVHPFALSYHVAQPDGTSVNYDGLRTPLPADVPPGGSVSLDARVVAPETPGTYVIEWDGVQEAVTWFSWAGTPAGRTNLTVAGQPAATAEPARGQTSAPPGVTPPPGRLTQWRIALRMVRNRPLLGVGPDNFRWVYGDFSGVPTWDTGDHANSLYFEWLADIGIVGLATYLWFAWRLLWRAARSLITPLPPDALWVWRLAFVASLAVWFLHSAVDYFYEPLPTNAAFWLIAALALAAAETTPAPSGTTGCVSPST